MSEWEMNKDTRQRIIDASIHLFGLKGYSGASTREIAKIAKVNIASLNYHFRSKQNLLQEVSVHVLDDFEQKLNSSITDTITTTADYSVLVFNNCVEDELRCLNHFKLFLDAENSPRELDVLPVGYKQLNSFFEKELHASVPQEEKLWATSVITSYIVNMAVMYSSSLGKKHIDKYMPEKKKTVSDYLHRLVNAVLRDLNYRYP